MKHLILLFLLLLLGSCASSDLRRFGTEKYFQFKEIHLKNTVVTHTTYGRVTYAIGKDVSCFDTADDRDVFTVGDGDFREAIQHFYFKTASYDIRKEVRSGNEILIATASSDTRVDVEIAYCEVVHSNHWIRNIFFLGNIKGRYASFRLAKKPTIAGGGYK